MALAFSTALQPPVRAAANSVLLEPPRPRLDAVSAVFNSAFASIGFSMPRHEPQKQLPEPREAPGAQAAANQQELAWPDDVRSRYRLGRVIGHGAFGTLRLATHRVTGECLAIKVRRPCLPSRQARLHACLPAEIRSSDAHRRPHSTLPRSYSREPAVATRRSVPLNSCRSPTFRRRY